MVNINVSEQRITAETTTQLVAGQLNYVPCHVYFDATWAKLKKSIQFRQNNLTLVKKFGDVDMANFYLPTELTAGPVIIAAMGEGDEVTNLTNEVSLTINRAGYLTDMPLGSVDFEALGYVYLIRQFDGSNATEMIAEVDKAPDAVAIVPASANVAYEYNADTGLVLSGIPADTVVTVTAIMQVDTAE